MGGAAGRRARGRRGAARPRARRAARWRSSPSSRSSTFDARGPRRPALRQRAQTESHRLIEHLMIAANEAVARLLDDAQGCRRSTASTSAPSPQRVERLVEQLASLDVPTPPLPEHDVAAAGRRRWWARSRRWSTSTCAAPAAAAPRSRSLVLRSLKQARYSPAQPRPRRPALAALLPLHLADPPLPGPRLPPRAAVGASAAGEDAPRAAELEELGRLVLRRASATRWRSSAPPTTSRAASCSSASCSSSGWRAEFDGRGDRA